MEFILYLIIISVIYLIFVLMYKTFVIPARLKRYGDKIPGPKPYPIFGNSGLFSKSESILKVIANVSETYGSVSRLWMGKNLLVLLNDPEDIKVILSSSKNLNKSDAYRFLEPWLGNTNLLLSKSDHWHTRRKLLTPSFHTTILENSIPIIAKNTLVMCEKLRSLLNEDEFEISLYIEKCSLDILGEAAMGTHLKTQISERSEFLDSLKVVTALTVKRMYNTWLHPSFLFRLTKFGRTYFKNLKILKEKGREVINERKKILEKNKEILIPSKSEANGKKYLPFLDFLLTESNYSDKEVENEVNTFMFAGHDTTTTSMSFCLYALSLNQSVQNKLVKEIKSVLLKKGELTQADFYSMNYLSCVIKESMRIYPTIPVISRKITEEVKLPSGYVIPLGSLVCINIFSMHRNEKYYENSLEFIPERFEVRDETRNTFSYIPFSGGPRSCIGQRFARLEMYVILSMILLEYQILPASSSEPPILEHNIVIRSLNGLRVRIKRRNLEAI